MALRIMFLCTANSCRSQMAEGLAKCYGKGLLDVHSAGLFASRVHPLAVSVMKEIGINISAQSSKEIDEALLENMDAVIILCSNTEKSCPQLPPGVRRIYWPVEDPVRTIGSEEDIRKAFREARDEIKGRVVGFIDEIKKTGGILPGAK